MESFDSGFVPMGDINNEHPKIEMPLGLSMSLAQDTEALAYFSALSDDTKRRLIANITDSATGAEAKAKIKKTVEMMKRHN